MLGIRKRFLSLWHGYSEYHTKYNVSGLRRALSSSTYSLYSEGLSPSVTLFLPKKEYARMVAFQKGNLVSFFQVLLRYKFPVTTTNARTVVIKTRWILLNVWRKIGYGENRVKEGSQGWFLA